MAVSYAVSCEVKMIPMMMKNFSEKMQPLKSVNIVYFQ